MWAVWYQQPLASLFTVGGGISEFDHEFRSRSRPRLCIRRLAAQWSMVVGIVSLQTQNFQ